MAILLAQFVRALAEPKTREVRILVEPGSIEEASVSILAFQR